MSMRSMPSSSKASTAKRGSMIAGMVARNRKESTGKAAEEVKVEELKTRQVYFYKGGEGLMIVFEPLFRFLFLCHHVVTTVNMPPL